VEKKKFVSLSCCASSEFSGENGRHQSHYCAGICTLVRFSNLFLADCSAGRERPCWLGTIGGANGCRVGRALLVVPISAGSGVLLVPLQHAVGHVHAIPEPFRFCSGVNAVGTSVLAGPGWFTRRAPSRATDQSGTHLS